MTNPGAMRPGCDRIGEEGDRDVPSGQLLAHDPGAGHSRQEQGCSEGFGYNTPGHSTTWMRVSRRG